MENIVTDRLIIRRFELTDWQDLYEYLSDEEVIKFEPYEVFSENQAREEAKNRANLESFYAVCLKENKKLIGNVYLGEGDFETFELGYVFNRHYQGNGYATESAKGIVEYAFRELGARRIIAMCNPKNDASWRLLERLKFRREGLLLKNIYFKADEKQEPIWLDTYEYALLKTEWLK